MTITCYSGYGGTSNSNNNNNKYLTQRYMRSTHFHRLSFPTQTQNSHLNVTQGEIRLCRSSFFWHFLRRREVWWDPWFFCLGGRAIHHGGPAGKWLMLFCFRWTAEERRVSANIIVIYTVEMRRGGEMRHWSSLAEGVSTWQVLQWFWWVSHAVSGFLWTASMLLLSQWKIKSSLLIKYMQKCHLRAILSSIS